MSYKILILVPSINAIGGIANYYRTLQNRFTYNVDYLTRGSRYFPETEGMIKSIIRIFGDFIQFCISLLKNKYDLVQITTPFSKYTLLRDGVFVLLARLLGNKVVIFFRGWDENFSQSVSNNYLTVFRFIFFKTNAIIELSSHNKERLIAWGYSNRIYLESTLVNEKLLDGVTKESIIQKFQNIESLQILFLSRIESNKGIYISLDAFRIIKEKYKKNITLHIVGDGTELNQIKQYIHKHKIPDVNIAGFLGDQEKIEYYYKSHIYLFPTMHGEGMSNSILEAMAFGLPVITRPVGGNTDILVHRKTGFLSTSVDPVIFSSYLDTFINDPKLMLEMGLNNYEYAKDRFYSNNVVKRIEKIYSDIINN